MEETDYLTTKEVAAELGVSLGRVQQMVANGRLPSVKVGRDRFVHKKDLELVRERKVGRPPVENPSKAAEAKRRQREKE
ncbi:MAG: helix-turn-helix domain-containing protein [Acidobacteriota bacterium]|nr:helix-turn-helix domain-containing protein [Acidobacteriota bacterium]